MRPSEAEKALKKSLILKLFLAMAEDSEREIEAPDHSTSEDIAPIRLNVWREEPDESEPESLRNVG